MRAGGVPSSSREVNPNPLVRRRAGAVIDRIAAIVIRGCAWTAILALVLIFVFIGKEAVPIFTSAEVHEETDLKRMFLPLKDEKPAYSWQPISSKPKYSILPLFLGTIKATVIAMLIAVPLAVGAAIFTSEFSPFWVREIIKPVIELLAGIPSVVVGFFCVMVLAGWLQSMLGWTFKLNAITAGIGLSLAVIPIIYTVAEDAVSSVPQTYREGSFAMGASRWQTAWKVVLPAASPGVFAACVLGFGRAIGETMIVLMASGNGFEVTLDPTVSFRTFSATVASELGEVVVGSAHYHVLFFIGALLFVLTFLTNFLGQWWVARLQKKMLGEI